MAVELRVIGAGFGRTRTDSMREALNILGYNPCHHTRSLLENEAHKMDWRKLNAGGEADWNFCWAGMEPV